MKITTTLAALILLQPAAYAQYNVTLNVSDGRVLQFEADNFVSWDSSRCMANIQAREEVELESIASTARACSWYIELDGLFYQGNEADLIVARDHFDTITRPVLVNCKQNGQAAPVFDFLTIIQPDVDPLHLDREAGREMYLHNGRIPVWRYESANRNLICDNSISRLPGQQGGDPSSNCAASTTDGIFCDGFE